ncbi:hypothetical protein DAF96_06575 [Clostridioides difficile]|uniref:hypothetical protein n=1 Tax=Clostridioides difficile TaxID=1496 RepID=UPI0010BA5817|nr:hypothetical protein [Clostridioides difficile]EGT5042803.1 hypothetical protein [Clostridioides difficile]MCK3711131.1 hypothetical protein [Clostridioides difficile]VHX72713.1 Uncharacterised protein [Clostridioides difficile]
MEYKYILILSYLNTMKSSYSYNEISNLFGLRFKQIEIMLNKMEEDNILALNKYYKLTQIGINILEQYNLKDIDFFNTMSEEENIFIGEKIDIEEIYIPNGFTKKVK